jgi:hypothetical protein
MTTNKKQRVTLFINPSIAKHARAQAIVEEVSLTHFVEKALITYLPKETVIKKADIRLDFDQNKYFVSNGIGPKHTKDLSVPR